MNGINVEKRGGVREPLDIEKIHKMVFAACDGLNVSPSQIEMSTRIQFFDGIRTADIQDILIKSAADMISLEFPDYQYAAARLLLFSLRKQVFGKFYHVHLSELIERCIAADVYDPMILEYYTPEEIDELDSYIDHDRDMLFAYAGLRQVIDKYLVQDRKISRRYETPQFMYMMIAATIFSQYPKKERMKWIKAYYDALSLFKINIPTPIMAGVRTPMRQYSSCVLIDIGDSLDSIFSSDMAIGRYVARRSGIGLNVGRIRGLGAQIRHGEVIHTGLIPFLKKFESTVRCCTQNGVRGGSATVHYPIWHQEVEDLLVLKNNKGTEDNRVRKMDYSVQISRIFYQRYIDNTEITLFSPHHVPGLYEAFGSEKFDDLYLGYEQDESVPKTRVGARALFHAIVKERAETGRVYIMNIDHVNSHSSFQDPIYMSNLCQEVTLPTDPITEIEGGGEIGVCILSAINLGAIETLDEIEGLADLTVRALDELIDFQDYPVVAAEIATKARRSLGVGFIGLAHHLARRGVKYEDAEAANVTDEACEALQYYLLKASAYLAAEKGACDYYDRTKYAAGLLPVDTYKKDVDKLVSRELSLDWESLRQLIARYGVRNSTLTAQMPSESSSVVSNETNGIEPPRDFLSIKKSKKGTLKQVVPEYEQLKDNYTLLWDMKGNAGYIGVVAAMQKYFDQSISGNWAYNPLNYENNEVPVSVMVQDLLNCYKYGWKTAYYQNTYDFKSDESDQVRETEEEDCDVCKI